MNIISILNLVNACLEQANQLIISVRGGCSREDRKVFADRLVAAEDAVLELQLQDSKMMDIRSRLAMRVAWKITGLLGELRRVLAASGNLDRAMMIFQKCKFMAGEISKWDARRDARPLLDLSNNRWEWWTTPSLRDRLEKLVRAVECEDTNRVLELVDGWPSTNFELTPLLKELAFLYLMEIDSPDTQEIKDALKAALAFVSAY